MGSGIIRKPKNYKTTTGSIHTGSIVVHHIEDHVGWQNKEGFGDS